MCRHCGPSLISLVPSPFHKTLDYVSELLHFTIQLTMCDLARYTNTSRATAWQQTFSLKDLQLLKLS